MRATSVAIVDLDLQFGDVGLSLGLAPETTIYDLVEAGGSLDAEKLDGYLDDARVRASASCSRRAGPTTRASSRSSSSATSTPCSGDVRLRRSSTRRPGFTPEVIATIDSSTEHLHGRDARRAVAQEHEARARDARADGLLARAHQPRAEPGRQPGRHHRRRRRRRSSAASPTCSCRATATSRARSTRASRSSSPSRKSEAAEAFRQLAALSTQPVSRQPRPTASGRASRSSGGRH